jgi:gamma-glutamyltranspeptidase / glutathione hydrolase
MRTSHTKFSFKCFLSVLFILTLLLATNPLAWGNPQETPGVPSHTGKAFRQGVVSVSNPFAAEAGAQVLENHGNAIDAAAAIQFALNVVESEFSGIGGGGFMMVHLASTGETFMLDCREKAPAAATPTFFGSLTFTQASNSGISVGVPGTLLGVATALKKWGTISLADALQPAIRLAEEGFKVNRFLAADTGSSKTLQQPETKAVFRLPDGSPLPEGYLLKQPDLAKTFRLIARKGVDVFYRGEIAQAIVNAQKRTLAGAPETAVGKMTLADLKQYNVKIREPIIDEYRGYTIMSASPPSSGGLTVIQMLKMLERFPIGNTSQGYGFGTTKTLNVMIEAMRLAFADRAIWMGDEDFVDVPKEGLLNDNYVALRSALIIPGSRMSPPTAGDPWPYETASLGSKLQLAMIGDQPEGGHTTHFSVVDKHGNIVAYTTTIEAGWGTGIMVPGYGFLLNNELTDFNMVPTYNQALNNPGANDVDAFKRPRSSISPTILFKGDHDSHHDSHQEGDRNRRYGEPFAAFGSPGGATIINSVLQITLNLIDHGMTIQEAIDAARISTTSTGSTVSYESGIPTPSIDGLRALGYSAGSPTSIGSVQAVVIDLQTGKQYGGADSRREGTVIGLPRPQGHK